MFWIISAILITIGIAFILPALFRREYEQDATREQNISIAKEQLAEIELRFEKGDIEQRDYQETKQELEISLYNDLKESEDDVLEQKSINHSSKSIANWLIILLVPIIAVPVYLQLGNLDFTKQLDSRKAATEVAKSTMPLKPDGSPDIEKITQNLKAEMESNPTDPKGWYMLGRSYMLIERFDEAVESFEKSLSLRPDLAETMLSLADALSMKNNGLLIGRPRALVKKALITEPENITALWLSGMAASQETDYDEAIEQWQKILPFIEDKPDEKTAVVGLIEEAKNRLSETNQANDNQVTNNQTKPKTNNTITVQITLSDVLKDKASANDLVFVYAKAMSGPPMPLAAVRKQVKDFPIDLVLDDDMAMIPNLKLSSFQTVIVGARVSKTGKPIAENGDLFTEKTDIKLGESVTLEIDQIYQK